MIGISTEIEPGRMTTSQELLLQKSSGALGLFGVRALLSKVTRHLPPPFAPRQESRAAEERDKIVLLERQRRHAERLSNAGVDAEIVRRLLEREEPRGESPRPYPEPG